ncbi:MAG: hypothetical protein JSW46_10285 [Gemmatimonadota bacterium]|nr:MAG: hypothetical protein JSW46_10285 [Gemmatimonadota bacterium]
MSAERDQGFDRNGFGITAAILCLIVLSALALFGVSLQINEHESQIRSSSRTIAFYAAETGLVRGLENWRRPDVIEEGETWLVDEGTLMGGARYRVEGMKLDDAGNVHGLFAVRAVGLVGRGHTRETAMLVATVPLGSPVHGALRTIGQVKIAGRAEVDGHDMVPPNWWDDCPPMLEHAAGVTMTDTTKMSRSGAAAVDGEPAVDENPDTTGYFSFGDMSYEEVAAEANITLPHGTNVSGTQPVASYTFDGKCDTSDPYNWGEPEIDMTPCSDWFPIIHVTGDLTLSGSGSGQGILLVDGNLALCGGATFYGPVVVKGMVKSCGSGFRLFGGVVAGESDLNVAAGGVVVGASQIQYSACVVERAISRSRAGRPRPLIERPWFARR